MSGIIEGVVSRSSSEVFTSNTTKQIRTSSGFGVPKFAVIDLYIRAVDSTLNTSDTNVKKGYGHTRVFAAGFFWAATQLYTKSVDVAVAGTTFGYMSTASGLSTDIVVGGMSNSTSSVTIDLVTDGVDLTFGGTSISSGAAIGYGIVRMYTGRGILNASVVNQQSNTTTSPAVAYQPNTLLAMTADLIGNASRSLSFGACDHNLNQASYGIAVADGLNQSGTVCNNTKALRSIAHNGTFREEVSWEVLSFTSTGWTNTVSVETYASTQPIAVLAIEMEDPTEFEVGIAVDTNSLSSTVDLSGTYSNLNWETVRRCTINQITQRDSFARTGLSVVTITQGGNIGLSWSTQTSDHYQLNTPKGGSAASVLGPDDSLNTWSSSSNAGATKVIYTRTTGTAVAEDCVYLSWGFVKTPLYNVLVGEEYITLNWVGADFSVKSYLGSTSLNNYV